VQHARWMKNFLLCDAFVFWNKHALNSGMYHALNVEQSNKLVELLLDLHRRLFNQDIQSRHSCTQLIERQYRVNHSRTFVC